MAVILLRHTTPCVAPGMCYGQMDLPVADSFDAEAKTVINALPQITRIVSSPLQRCRQLAVRVAQSRQLPVLTEPDFQEMSFGRWEGVFWGELPREELEAWAADFLDACPHGGETVAALRARTRRGLEKWACPDETTLCVTHAGVIRAALSTGDTASDFNTQIEFGGMIQLPLKEGMSQ